ncbi:XRCC4-like factor-domain-containing protein [Lipomyces doorenjongii]
MENPGKIRWVPLCVSPSDQPPVILLAHFTCTTDSYSFTVTDLQSLWVDSASKDDIIDRALQDRCIVDVSQSANLNVLLARLSDSLTGNVLPEGTKLEAMRFAENLRITMSLQMSASSRPLVWIFRLQSAPSSHFCHDIFLGSLGIIDVLQSQISALQAIASEKDYHISALQEVLQECHANLYAPRRYRDSFAQFNAETWLQSWKDSKTTTCKASEIYLRGVNGCSQWWGWCANGKWEITDGDFNDIQIDDQGTSRKSNNTALPGLGSKRKHYASSSSNESRVRSEHGKGQRSRRMRREENEDDESSSGNENQIKSVIGGRRKRRNDADSDSEDNQGKESGRTGPKQRLTREGYEDADDASNSSSESESQSSGMIIGGRYRQSQASPPPKLSQTVTGELLRRSPSSSDEEEILSRAPSSAPSAHGVIGGGMIGGSTSRSSKRATPIGRNSDKKDTSPSPLPMHQSGSLKEQQETSVKPRHSSPPNDAGDIATERRRMPDAQLQARKRVPVRRRF